MCGAGAPTAGYKSAPRIVVTQRTLPQLCPDFLDSAKYRLVSGIRVGSRVVGRPIAGVLMPSANSEVEASFPLAVIGVPDARENRANQQT